MERDPFDRLSAELIKPILFDLPNTQSIYSLIRASPKCYQVFLTAKEKILISIMRQTIQPAAFIDALAAVQASQLKEKGPDRKKVLAFLRKYENKRHKALEPNGKHYSLSTAVSLCQLYRSSQYFINDLTGRSNFYLRRCGDTTFIQTRFSPRDGFHLVQEMAPTASGEASRESFAWTETTSMLLFLTWRRLAFSEHSTGMNCTHKFSVQAWSTKEKDCGNSRQTLTSSSGPWFLTPSIGSSQLSSV